MATSNLDLASTQDPSPLATLGQHAHWLVRAALAGAIALVHWSQWSFVASETHPMCGMEFQTLLLALGIYLVARGNDV